MMRNVLTLGKAPLLEAIERHVPNFAPAVIFDVGAHEGRASVEFAKAFPAAEIYAFEPVAATFAALVDRVKPYERVHPFELALGRRSGRVTMRIKGASVSNRIARWRDLLKPTEGALMTRGDEFCRQHGIEQIGILKIDAEGHDLEILRGFRSMLRSTNIDLVEAEVGMNPENRLHVPFTAVKSYLERRGYRLFQIYEQALDTPFSGRPVIRRSNVVFASSKLIEANLER
jgi:FkbM family methyltransferase